MTCHSDCALCAQDSPRLGHVSDERADEILKQINACALHKAARQRLSDVCLSIGTELRGGLIGSRFTSTGPVQWALNLQILVDRGKGRRPRNLRCERHTCDASVGEVNRLADEMIAEIRRWIEKGWVEEVAR